MQAFAEPADRLMVGAVDLKALAEQLIQHRPRLSCHKVTDVGVHMHIPALGHKVLIQVSAQHAVHNLKPAANTQNGFFLFEKRAGQRDFVGCALGICAHSVVENLFAVQLGAHIVAARQKQGVAQFGHLAAALLRGNDRHAACRRNGTAVRSRTVMLARLGAFFFAVIGIAGNTDDRLSHNHSSITLFRCQRAAAPGVAACAFILAESSSFFKLVLYFS